MAAESNPDRILIVEDDETLSGLIQRLLGYSGLLSERVSTGSEALARLKQEDFTLMLLDYRLPDMSGKQVVEQLPAGHARIPFIIITGYGDEKVAVDMMKLGAKDFLIKDVTFHELLPALVTQAVEQIHSERKLVEAEKAILKSRDLYLNMFEDFPTLIWRTGEGGSYDYFNTAWLRFTGRTLDDAIKEGVESRVHPDDLDKFKDTTSEAFQSVKPFELEYRMVRRDGEWRWILNTGRPFFDLDGNFSGFIGSCYDISERKKAEKMLIHRLEMEEVVAYVSAMLVSEHDANIQHVLAILGRAMDVCGASVVLFHDDGNSISEKNNWRSDSCGKVAPAGMNIEVANIPNMIELLQRNEVITLRDTSDFPVPEAGFLHNAGIRAMLAVPMLSMGKLRWALAFFDTRTPRAWSEDDVRLIRTVSVVLAAYFERKIAEKTLLHRLEVEEAVAQVSGMMVSDDTADFSEVLAILGKAVAAERASMVRLKEGGEMEMTDEWCASGIEPSILSADIMDASPFLSVVEKFATQHTVVINNLASQPDIDEIREEFLKSGVKSFLAVPLHSGSKIIGFLGFTNYTKPRTWYGEDVRLLRAASEILAAYTSRKQAEDELIKATKLESLGVLAGGIAHDFNNILTAILGNISLAKASATADATLTTRLTETENATLRARDLTQQLLTFSKGGTPVKKTAAAGELIRETAGFVLRGSKTLCKLEIPEDLMPVEIDAGQITQVLHNLIINADQAMPEGGSIEITAQNAENPEVVPPLKKGKYVQITVKDTGIGIPPDNIQKIFDPYFTTKKSGSGLGLATSYSIIKKHGGQIAVESDVGKGTKFILYLPASRKKIPAKAATGQCSLFSKGKVLLLDDEDIVRDVVGNMLTTLGYDVVSAKDCYETIDFYKGSLNTGERFDAVIMDLTIPGGMGGKEAIVKLREIDPEVRAIVSSGYSNDPIMADFKRYGFNGVIAKPFQLQELQDTLQHVISDHTHARPGGSHTTMY
jgi:PAS domain S-box-containing protein